MSPAAAGMHSSASRQGVLTVLRSQVKPVDSLSAGELRSMSLLPSHEAHSSTTITIVQSPRPLVPRTRMHRPQSFSLSNTWLGRAA